MVNADPQDRVTEPFDFQINTKILSKDNHRPCVPRPLAQKLVYPQPNNIPICETIVPVCHVPTMPPSISWQRRRFNYTILIILFIKNVKNKTKHKTKIESRTSRLSRI